MLAERVKFVGRAKASHCPTFSEPDSIQSIDNARPFGCWDAVPVGHVRTQLPDCECNLNISPFGLGNIAHARHTREVVVLGPQRRAVDAGSGEDETVGHRQFEVEGKFGCR